MRRPQKGEGRGVSVVRLVFVDMDDTFLLPDKTVSAENLHVLDLAYERGVEVVPCTGRNATGLPRELVEHPCVGHAVCCNGAIICEAKTGRVLSEVDIERDVVRSLYEEVRDLDITFDVFTNGQVYTASDRWHVLDQMAVSRTSLAQIKSVRTRYEGTVDELLAGAGRIYRVNVFYLSEEDARVVHEAVERRPELTWATSLPCNVEITNHLATKGFGVRWLAERLGVPIEETVAFGDSGNDLTMLEVAGDGVAMANATAECLAVADHVAFSNAESGVARYLEPLLA